MRRQNFPPSAQKTNVNPHRHRLPPALAIAVVVISIAGAAGFAQEIVDPRTGQLQLEVTDLVVAAGPLTLDVTRTFNSGNASGGFLGPGWKFNWEISVHGSPPEMVIIDGGRATIFRSHDGEDVLGGPSGERLHFVDGQNAIRSDPGGVTSIYELHEGVGRPARLTDRNGNTIQLRYSGAGSLERIEGPKGSFLDFTADERGRVTGIQSSQGTSVHYTHIGDRLSEIRVNGGPPCRYLYDQSGMLIAIVRPSTGMVEFNYDEQGRVSRRSWADGSQETYEYADRGQSTRLTHPTGGTTFHSWSEDGRVEEITDPIGNTTRTQFNADFRPEIITDPSGATTRYSIDALDRITEIVDSQGQATKYEYLSDSNLVLVIHRTDGVDETFEYDDHGNLLTEKMDGATVRKFTYTPDGLIESLTGVGIPELRFTYLPNGLLETQTNAMGQVSRYRYDDRGNVVALTDAAGNTTRWEYDELNRLVGETDAGGASTTYSYDARGLLVASTDPTGAVTRFDYDGMGRVVTETDPLDRTTKYEHRPDGQLSRVVDPAGREVLYRYDAAGRMVREINPQGGITEYSYDAAGRVKSVSEPDGKTWSYEYSIDGAITSLTTPSGFSNKFALSEGRQEFEDPAGRVTSDTYNRLGQLTERHLPSGVRENYRYDAAGNLVEISTDTGLSASIDYDRLGRPLRVVLPTGLEVRHSYDSLGNLTHTEDNMGSAASMRFDPAGRVAGVVEADGATTRYQYDAAGRLVEKVDPRGHTTSYSYDAAGQLTGISDPRGETIGLEYDGAGWLISVLDARGGVTSFIRDWLGNSVLTADPGGRTVERVFDSAGRLLREVESSGQTTNLQYNEAGRLSRKTLSDGTVVAYTYDASGNPLEIDDGSFPVRYGYDERGNQTSISYPTLSRSLSFEFDQYDRLKEFVDSEGRTVRYQFDSFDRLTGVVTPNEEKIVISYDAADRPVAINYPNGTTELWRYDTADRPLVIAFKDRMGNNLALRRYTYDTVGNPIQVSDTRGDVTRYRYDPSDQLVEESGPWGFRRYTYLADGSRASLTDGAGTTEYVYDSRGRLGQAGDESFGYDARGNMIERHGPGGKTSYVFDSEDRLVSATLPDGETIRFGYAPTGERIWRETEEGRTWFISDGDHRLADLDEGLGLEASYLYGPWLDRPLMVSSGEDLQWFLRDTLGTVIGLCDAAGKLIADYRFDAFGNELSTALEQRSSLLFTAREYEPKLGLYYYRARYYDPSLGRFISADPFQSQITDPLSTNRYIYVRNAPTRFTDPMGLRGEQLWTPGQPLPRPDQSVTALVRKMSQRYGTPQGRTAQLVVEEYRHLQRLSDLQHRVPNPRRLPRLMRERPSLHEAAERVRNQLELNRLFHRPGVDPRSPSSSLEGARRFLGLERQRETAEAVTSLRNRGSTPPDWAVKPRNTKTVGTRAPGVDGTSTGAQPASSTSSGTGSSGGGSPPAPATNSGGVAAAQGAGGAAASGSGSAGPAQAPKLNPNYRPKPLSTTRGPWGPVKPTPLTTWQKLTRPPTAGQSTTLTLLLTTEMIFRCRAQKLTVGQCADQFVKGLKDNWLLIAGTVTVCIVAPTAGMVVVAAAGVYKAITDVMEFEYERTSARQAEQGLERILKERKDWTEENIGKEKDKKRLLLLETKIEETAKALRSACKNLAGIADRIESTASTARAELAKKPSAETINAGSDACRTLPDKEARLRAIQGDIGALVDQIKGEVETARSLAEACRTKSDAVKLKALIEANDAALGKIEKAAAEAKKIQGELDRDRAKIDAAQSALRRAMDLRQVLTNTANVMPPIAATEVEVGRAEAAIDLLTEPSPSLGNDIKNLVKAFGEYDDLSLEMISKINHLRQLVRDAQPLVTGCTPSGYLPRHRDAADKIVTAKLQAQTLIDQVDAAPLTNCNVDPLRTLAGGIKKSAEGVAGLRAVNDEAKNKAKECLARHGLSITDLGGGAGSGTSSSSTGSGTETPPLVEASRGGSEGGGGGGKPPLVDASKPGGPTTGGDPAKLPGSGTSTAVKPQPGEEELVYANLDIELAQDDYGIYDILDNFMDAEIIIKTPQGEKQYLGGDAIKYLESKGWIIHKIGVGWIATDRLKRFLGIGEPDDPTKPKGSGRPTLGGMTYDGPLENYDRDDPNTPEGKKKLLRERLSVLSRQCDATPESIEKSSCREKCSNLLFSEYGRISQDRVNACIKDCDAVFEQKKPQVCREAEAVQAQLEQMK